MKVVNEDEFIRQSQEALDKMWEWYVETYKSESEVDSDFARIAQDQSADDLVSLPAQPITTQQR